MDKNTEIIPIAIPEIHFRQNIAELVEHLLLLDDKLFNPKFKEAK